MCHHQCAAFWSLAIFAFMCAALVVEGYPGHLYLLWGGKGKHQLGPSKRGVSGACFIFICHTGSTLYMRPRTFIICCAKAK